MKMGFSTKAIHAAIEPDPVTGSIMTPIHLTSTYVQEELGKHKGYEYSRVSNPTRSVLEHQIAILESQPKAAMVYGNTQYWYSWSGKHEDKMLDFIPKLGVRSNILYTPPTLLRLFLEGNAAVPCSCSILVRSKALEAVGGFEERFRDLYEDQALYAKICLEMPVFVSDKCLEKYRQHPEQSCSVAEEKSGQTHFARLEYLEWTATYLSKRAFTDTEVWQALNRELWLYRHLRTRYLPGRTLNSLRYIKKWLLILEERIMPGVIRRRLWS